MLPLPVITSLTFILLCVPEPVCHTLSGNSLSCFPLYISSQAFLISSHLSSGSFPSSRLTSAAAFLSIANALITGRGIVSVPMLKLLCERSVCAPHRAFSGTFTSPIESLSILYFMAASYSFSPNFAITILSRPE